MMIDGLENSGNLVSPRSDLPGALLRPIMMTTMAALMGTLPIAMDSVQV
jgi:hypothetical protein